MLVEIRGVRQVPGEGRRRWFTDSYFDLIVWYTGDHAIGFQLCYDKQGNERALTWFEPRRYAHTRIDGGEGPFGHKMTPVLAQDGVFDRDAIAERFRAACANIDPAVVELVCSRLQQYPLEAARR